MSVAEITQEYLEAFDQEVDQSKFCHTVLGPWVPLGALVECYCGYRTEVTSIHVADPLVPVCPGCGKFNCPKCAEVVDLELRLGEV